MIVLHHCHQTRSMRSLWLLYELGIDFDISLHSFDKALRSNDYLAINPSGRVPALELDGVTVWESGAITQVLCERFDQQEMGRLPEHPERVEWLIWVHFSETISQHTAALTQQHVALYDDTMRSPIVMKLEAKRLEKCYAAVEQRLEKSGDYLLEGGFSAADISVGQAIYMGKNFARIEPFEKLTRWYQRITDRPAFRASLPPENAVLLYRKDFYEVWDG
ncbi:MAG: glutathione S-transferase family protein [Paracoccaceae bacterium]